MVELMVVSVLGALVVAATYQVLITNQRTYTAQNVQIQSQQTVRAGLDVLFAELRELSRAGGDIQAFGPDSLKMRAIRRFGLVCGVNLTLGTIDVRKYGSWFEVNDSIVVYAENRPATGADDDWIRGKVLMRDTTITCGGKRAQRLHIPEILTAAIASPPDSVRVGANVRTFTHYTYGLYTIDGEPYLGRKNAGSNTPTALVGPLQSGTGLAFRYLDTLNAVTTTSANIAQIELVLRTASTVRGPNGGYVKDSIRTRIALRN